MCTSPSRSSRCCSPGGTSRRSTPLVFVSASRSAAVDSPGSIPTITGRDAVEGNASASAIEMTIGKRNVQKIASGSRRNSRTRARVSWNSGELVIAQVSAGERHEDVLEGPLLHDDFGRDQRGDQRLRRSL